MMEYERSDCEHNQIGRIIASAIGATLVLLRYPYYSVRVNCNNGIVSKEKADHIFVIVLFNKSPTTKTNKKMYPTNKYHLCGQP